jgi:hypothetical protein
MHHRFLLRMALLEEALYGLTVNGGEEQTPGTT